MEINIVIIDKDEKGYQYIYHSSCGKRSYNSNDIKHRYCGFCNEFPEDIARRRAILQSIQLAENNY